MEIRIIQAAQGVMVSLVHLAAAVVGQALLALVTLVQEQRRVYINLSTAVRAVQV